MGGRRKALVIGSPALRDELALILPDFDCAHAELPLQGVWLSGHDSYELILLPLLDHPPLPRVLDSLRAVTSGTRIVLVTDPAREPLAIAAAVGRADDYVLLPLCRRELDRALGQSAPAPVGRARAPQHPSHAVPAVQEVSLGDAEMTGLTAALRQLGGDAATLLASLGNMLRTTFHTAGVRIEFGSLVHAAGEMREPLCETPLKHGPNVVGRLTISAALGAAPAPQKLAQYARLVEALLSQSAALEQARKLANLDDLSGLYNRRCFDALLAAALERAIRERRELSVLLFDLDGFKEFNDRYGHQTGDHVIREVARLLRLCTREGDSLARYGGDEFAVIFKDDDAPRTAGSRHPSSALALIERFCEALRSHDFKLLGAAGPGPLTISGGLATYPWDAKTPADLLRAADMALLEAKRTGKNRVALGRSANPTA